MKHMLFLAGCIALPSMAVSEVISATVVGDPYMRFDNPIIVGTGALGIADNPVFPPELEFFFGGVAQASANVTSAFPDAISVGKVKGANGREASASGSPYWEYEVQIVTTDDHGPNHSFIASGNLWDYRNVSPYIQWTDYYPPYRDATGYSADCLASFTTPVSRQVSGPNPIVGRIENPFGDLVFTSRGSLNKVIETTRIGYNGTNVVYQGVFELYSIGEVTAITEATKGIDYTAHYYEQRAEASASVTLQFSVEYIEE